MIQFDKYVFHNYFLVETIHPLTLEMGDDLG